MKLTDQQVIDVFKALSDPNRLQIFYLLMDSDRTNSELMDQTGLRQNLLSHHLSILTDCGLIQTHRSIGDARRHYYSPRLEMANACREWWQTHSPPESTPLPALQQPRAVLFLCLSNGARSFLAEALTRHLAADALVPASAGIEPINSEASEGLDIAQKVLAEHDIPTFDFKATMYEELDDRSYDCVVTVCDIVHEKEFPPELSEATLLHWSLVDPMEEGTDDASRVAAMRDLVAHLKLRLAYFVQRLAVAEGQRV